MSKNHKVEYLLQRALKESCAFGSSRHAAKQNGTDYEHIYSHKTYQTYSQTVVKPFGKWAHEHNIHRDINACRDAVPQYLNELKERGLSNYSLSTHSAGLHKAFHLIGIEIGGNSIKRSRSEISRSRGDYSHRFNADKHFELANFVHSTGLRRREIETLTRDALHTDERGREYLHIVGKGGKARDVYPFGSHAADALERVRRSPADEYVWGHQPSYVPLHRMRAEAAAILYHELERPLDSLNREDKYYCQRDRAGDVYDRKALLEVSKTLGHERLDVVVNHYAYLF